LSITQPECVCVGSLGFQHAMRVRHIVVCGLPRFTTFSAFAHKRHDFRKKVTEHKMCVLILSIKLAETFLILRKVKLDMITNVCRSSSKVPVIIVRL
jgi:hypothetical protein